MRPKKPDNSTDLFRSQLSQMLNMQHPLIRLSCQINWEKLEQEIDVIYSTGSGQPPLPTRLLVGLHYLKYSFNESDESVVERWVENPYWQYFCGYEYLQHQLPLHPTSLVKWRNRVGDKLEALLTQTIEVAQQSKAISARELDHINVDTTVQEKNITFPTDAKLYHKMREKLVNQAKAEGIELRQSYKRVGKKALIMQSRYAHARQMKRVARQTRKLKTYLGRVIRDIDRKASNKSERLEQWLIRAKRLHEQQRTDKNKIYSVHEDVYCIAKGKAHKRYEFGNKVSVVSSSKNNWLVSVQSLANEYDGHTLQSALEHTESLTGNTPKKVYCDLGYRGHKVTGEVKVHLVGKLPKRATRSVRRWMKRRAAVEPLIGHLKSDHRLDRNYLRGRQGDQINVILSAAGFNFTKLLAWFCWVFRKLRFMEASGCFLGKLMFYWQPNFGFFRFD